jgi:membrane-associated phospholipid phosphatase
LIFLLVALVVYGAWVIYAGKANSFRALTGFHSSAADLFFSNVTHLGDGIFILALAGVLALFKKYFLSLGIVAGYLLSGLFAQLGKRLVSAPRPKAYFELMGEKVYEMPGVDVHLANSFPSGHTASVFALAVFLVLSLPYRWYSWAILLAALLVGYSRIYLSQHFPTDVLAGAIIGSLSGLGVFFFLKSRAMKQEESQKDAW